MTIADFLNALQLAVSGQRYTPFVDAFGYIRLVDENNWTFCPLTLVCRETTGYIFKEVRVDDVADIMGIDRRAADEIARAADFKHYPLRRRLVEAVFGDGK